MELALRACHELLESKLFEILLAYVLAVGNLINASNSKGTTKGIRLSSLQKVALLLVVRMRCKDISCDLDKFVILKRVTATKYCFKAFSIYFISNE